MIYPTRSAVLAAAAGAPVALLIGVMLPARWYAGLAWPVAVLLLTIVDALSGARRGEATLSPLGSASVGATVDAKITVRVRGSGAPGAAQVALAGNALLGLEDDGRLWIPLEGGQGAALMPLVALRRGMARLEAVWLRWRGPLGLVWKQQRIALDGSFAIIPDVRPVRERGAQIFQRHAINGLIAQVDRGDGADFDALVEFRSGMDRRAIDWKQSARHFKLHAKEYRTERNNQIVFAIDAGRQMSEPVGGLPRVDRAVSAMLLTAWVALKLGDRVALNAFDSRPRIASGLISGVPAFAELQRLAAAIDYSTEETNYTFALTTLATRLTRRSMIVLFTEFTDLTSADFMVRAAARIVEKHLLLVVVLRDEEVEAIADQLPETPDDVTRAVTAAALLRDRRLALARLQHLGVHVIESDYDKVGETLVAGYVDLKRRNLL
ncbi:MAG: hypothetical protein JWL96_3488 [Sphingomonas bacterium]|uniref:DUF58 domain-containing protein n=1 Tax=Sphingomonas bacterium TaxID=1895847 RepID=UPI00260AE96D|nr:DUF58 domain-containing protein [Sphingomonas bacterium]MDB5711418.1 hypothetical protein [Sphingomonas bacterium]